MKRADAKHLAASALGESMVSMRDIADYLGVGFSTVKAWRYGRPASSGKRATAPILPTPDFEAGGVCRWRRSTIDAFVASRSGRKAA